MKPSRFALTLIFGALLISSPSAFAQGNGHGHGHGHDKHGDDDDRDDDREYYRGHDREVRGWYDEHREHLPPGLAKKDHLPPGL
ncbi:hypothetical protein ABI028_15630, partial [Enterococcus faecium]|uniref:hypothetical protein n=1 Tax=Enterococcus faecium TaxID=1352 RepID=UPI003F4389D5